jgi:hypothetical protein
MIFRSISSTTDTIRLCRDLGHFVALRADRRLTMVRGVTSNHALLQTAHKSCARGALSGLLCWLDAPRTGFCASRRSRTRS